MSALIVNLTDKAREQLYSRWHSTKSKALKRGEPFQWKKFDDFLPDFLDRAPTWYTPENFRLVFDLGLGKGYCAEAIQVVPVKKKMSELGLAVARNAEQVIQGNTDALVAELSILLATPSLDGEMQDLDDLCRRAKERA